MIRDIKTRINLAEAIPLSHPLVIHIDTNNTCNFQCKFCTTGDHALLKHYNRPLGTMSFETFCKIIDDLTEFSSSDGPTIKDLLMHKNGEPLLHKDIVRMISYVKSKDVAGRVILVTNGSMITPKLARDIASTNVDIIQISISHVTDMGYKQISNADVSYNDIVMKIAYLWSHINHHKTRLIVKLMNIGLSKEEKQIFLDDFHHIADETNIEHPISYTQPDIKDTSLGIQKDTTNDYYKATYKEICTLPFYTMSINFNGKVSACSFDWRHKHIMGNIHEQSLKSIWHGELYSEFRKMQASKQRHQNQFCNGCEAVYNLIDNIDDYGDEILKRINMEK
jgi:radical SAM protein with 4Fe4S-binding SPASM domain